MNRLLEGSGCPSYLLGVWVTDDVHLLQGCGHAQVKERFGTIVDHLMGMLGANRKRDPIPFADPNPLLTNAGRSGAAKYVEGFLGGAVIMEREGYTSRRHFDDIRADDLASCSRPEATQLHAMAPLLHRRRGNLFSMHYIGFVCAIL